MFLKWGWEDHQYYYNEQSKSYIEGYNLEQPEYIAIDEQEIINLIKHRIDI